MTEIENNPHQALIEEKVAEFKETSQTYIKCGWDETNNLAFKQFEVNWTEQQVDWLTQTLQATIDIVLERERERASEYMTPEGGAAYLQALTPLPDKE